MTTVNRATTTCGIRRLRVRPARAPALLLALLTALVGCDANRATPATERRPDAVARVDAARLAAAPAEAEQWLTTGRTAHEERYSPLAQIDAGNVGRLGFAWEYRTGTQRGLEATPIVVDGVLYTSGNFGAVYALDAATGRALWTWDPRVPGVAARKACCDAVNRGVAAWQGKVYVGTLDGRLVALDAATGEVAWQADTIVDRARGYTSTGAPRIAGGVVVIGNAGAEAGVRGYVSGYDAGTGELKWRFFTVPGNPAGPFEHPELEQAAATWDPDSRWDVGGGGTAWDGMAYDAELDLLYVGTGNATPYPVHIRSPRGGDNLFVSSILAIRPATGRLAWHYQTTPGDSWDYTATQNIILATLEIDGARRRVLMQAPKNGFFYVLDRETGQLISAEKYAQVNWASHVDLATGRPVVLPAAHYRDKPAQVFPANQGAHNWQPMAFHPGTGLVYIPVRDVGMTFKAVDRYAFDIASSVNDGLDYAAIETTPPEASLLAWDPRRQRAAWRVDHDQVRNGGLLATAGNLVLQGTVDGRLTAYRANDGQQLLALETGTSIMAAPATYAVDGTQYVVVMAGYGGSGLKHYPEGSAARRYGNEGRILAFRLDGGPVPLPPEKDWDGNLPAPPALPELTAAERGRARQKFFTYCFVCHNLADEPAGYPNLLRLDAAAHARFSAVVLGGALESRGMASFADVLTEDDARVVQGLLIGMAHEARARKGAARPPR